MKYFKDADKAVKVLEYAKQAYKEEHDRFHKFNLELLRANPKRDNFYTFFEKVAIMDIQSKPYKSPKYEVLRIFNELEKKFAGINFREKFKRNKEGLLNNFYENLLSIKYIGHKIANLIVKNVVCFGNAEKYFGFRQDRLPPLLRVPVDVHVANLLCYRLQISPIKLYDKIRAASGDKQFQCEVREICKKPSKLNPIDLDILWYIGYQNCNKRIYCSACKVKKYCKDPNFTIETEKNVKDKHRIREEIRYIKKYSRKIN